MQDATTICLDCGANLPPRPPGRTGPAPKRCGTCQRNRDRQLSRQRHARGKNRPRTSESRPFPRGCCMECGQPTDDRNGPGVADYCATCKKERVNALAKKARFRRLASRFAGRFCACGAELAKPAYGPWPKDCPGCTKARKRERSRRFFEALRKDPKAWAEYLDTTRPFKQEWKIANAEWVRERDRQWRLNNPHKKRETKHRRRVRLAAVGGPGVSDRDWCRLLRRYGSRCAYCGSSGSLTMDHIVPIARGGWHSIGNVLPACKSCNSSKCDALLIYWRSGRAKARLRPAAVP